MNNKKNKKNKAFTLIELLVVIAILGVLASIILISTKELRGKARDARRASELSQVAKALEIYYLEIGSYSMQNDKTDPEHNWYMMLSELKDGGFLGKIDAVKDNFSFFNVFKNLILLNSASVVYGYGYGYSQLEPQDPLYPDQTYEYMVSVDGQSYRIRAKLEDLNNLLLDNSIDGPFLYTSQTSGSNACDPSLGYYCIGVGESFAPGD